MSISECFDWLIICVAQSFVLFGLILIALECFCEVISFFVEMKMCFACWSLLKKEKALSARLARTAPGFIQNM